MNTKNYFWRWFLKGTSLVQIIVGVFITFFIIGILFYKSFDLSESWSYIEPIISGFTLIAAVFIWYNEKQQEWRESLPKKMDVDYILDGETFWSVKMAPLASEQDIRAWGQSIVKTIGNDKSNVDLKGFEILSAESHKETGKPTIMLYKVHFYLKNPIKHVVAGSVLTFDSNGIAQFETKDVDV